MSGWNPPPQSPGGNPGGYPPAPGGAPNPYGQPAYGQQPGYGQPAQPSPPAPPAAQPGWAQQDQPGWGQPPGGFAQPQPGFGPPPGPPPRNSKTGLVLGLVGGGLVLVVIAVVAVVALSGAGGDKYTISTPDSVAGRSRDSAMESQLASKMDSLKTQMRTMTHGKVTDVSSAFYKDPGSSGGLSGSTGVIFFGGTGPIGNPSSFMSGIRSSASRSGTSVQDVDAGSHGGKAGCFQLSSVGVTITECAWATSSSFGAIVPTKTGSTISDTAALMRTFRDAVEQKK
ncbi:hypothetical protein AB0J52_07295 [Spirillospora sp. NPDC049652]